MKKSILPLLLLSLLPVVLAVTNTFAQGYSPSSPEYSAAKASLLPPPAPGLAAPHAYIHPPSAGLVWSDGCYINYDSTYSELPANDDESTDLIDLPFIFSLYGTEYTSLYLNNNGNITFNDALPTYTPSGFPITTPMVAPFWGDVMTTPGATARYKVFPHKFIATWSNVGYYNAHYSQTDSFQLIITDGTDASIGLGNNVAFHYSQMNWTTGDVSGGVGGYGGSPATVGINSGDGVHFVQVGRFGQNSSVYGGSSSSLSNGVHYLEYNCFSFNVSGGGNIPPSVSGLPSGSIDTIMCGTVRTYYANWIGPEPGQNDSSYVDTGDVCNMVIRKTNGFTAVSRDTISITGAACNMGTHHFYVTGVDDHGGVTIDTVTIVVVPFVPHASSNSPVCGGSSLNLTSATDGPGAVYSWTGPGGFTSSLQNPVISGATPAASGKYYLTVTTPGGCSSVDSVMVTVYAVVTATASAGGPISFCAGGSVVLSVTGGVSRVWSTGATTSSITVTSSGTYTATVSDIHGCTASSAPIAVTVNAIPSAIAGAGTVCAGETITLTDATPGGTWSSSNPSVATISAAGIVSGIAAGNATISYSGAGDCASTITITVKASPASITGSTTLCAGTASTLADATTGSWTSSNASVATIGAISGIVTAVAPGTATITLTAGNGCTATTNVTINPIAGAISGASSVCVASAITLSATSSGTWSSGSADVATVSSSGVVTGITAGTAIISFTAGTGCFATKMVSVIALPGAITGITDFCAGSSAILTSTTTGGTWNSSNSAVATVSGSGGVSAVAAGTALISYTATTGCLRVVTVNVSTALPAIAGSRNICLGTPSALTNSTSGGTWSSSNTAVATINTSTGLVTGVAVGTALISYRLGAGCYTFATITVNTVPSAIAGVTSVCVGSSITLTDATSGGTWSSGNIALATVDVSGVVSGVSAGTVSITYTSSVGCSVTRSITVRPLPAPIAGTLSACVGATTALSDATTGGTSWTSSTTSVATVISGSGVVTGVTSGTSIITYTLSTGCYITAVVTINPLPSAITGTATVCSGSTTDLDATSASGGTWSSGTTAKATVNATSGVVTGVAAGTSQISFTSGLGCRSMRVVTVLALPNAITGNTTVCLGSTTALSNTTTGGTWSSGDAGTASVSSTGVVTGNATGTAAISYTAASGCSQVVIVTVTTAAPDITGSNNVCVGKTVSLSNTASGGTWSSSSTSIATVVSATGVVTGVSVGSVNITYTLTAGCRTTMAITVNPAVAAISGATSVCVNSSITLTSASADGTWSSSNISIGTVDPSGNVMGIAAGSVTITYTLSTGCFATKSITIKPLPAAIAGPTAVCQGSTITLTDATTGGASWQSSNTSVATVGLTSGVVTGVAEGTTTITYLLSTGCAITKVISVNPQPSVITGTPAVCVGQVTDLSITSSSGGTWTSGTTAKATVDASTGVVTGIAAGTSAISFTSGVGCIRTFIVTVNALPNAITGNTSVCLGSTTALSNTTTGGVWSSSDAGTASVSSAGVVSGNATGAAVISYTNTSGCFQVVTVTVTTGAPDIAGSNNVCIGKTVALSNSASGGTWSSSNTSIATVISTSGVVTGASVGSFYITYTISAGCRSVMAMSVNPAPAAITGATSVCVNSSITLACASADGTWSSSNTSIGTVDGSGNVTGIAAGTATITYTLSTGCFAIKAITIKPLPAAISGASTVCQGSTTTLTDATTGSASWSSSNPSVGSVGATSGIVMGIAEGITTIAYTLSTGCSITKDISVNPLPSPITGTATVCAGQTTSLSAISSTGGTWTSGTTAKATVDASTGLVTGVAAGTSAISFTSGAGCIRTFIVTVNTLPNAITGNTTVCLGSTAVLSNTTTGGTWSSSDAGTASISSTGVVSGNATGAAVISYTNSSGCFQVVTITVTAGAPDIAGSDNVCVGKTVALSNSASGGTWSSSNTSIATVISTSGVVTGASVGSFYITYTISAGCRSVMAMTVNPAPAAITGATSVCVNSSITLTSASAHGTWSSSNSSLGTVDASGNVTGIAAGSVTITYTLSTGCFTTKAITIKPLPAAISGASVVCQGSTITLSNATTGSASWSSSNTSVGTIGATSGVVTGIAEGTTTITYTLSTGCSITKDISVNPLPSAITGSATVCVGQTTGLSATSPSGGTWTSGTTAKATVDPSTGVVTGIAAGTSAISFTSGAGCLRTFMITVNALPNAITGNTTVCLGSTTALSSTTTGGAWSSSDAGTASVSSTGVVSGNVTGAAVISYTNTSGCFQVITVTVTTGAPDIAGSNNVCIGKTVALSNSASGGTWSSSSTSIVTVVSTSGVVTGVSVGSVNITYSLTAGCRSIMTMTVNPAPAAIAGATSVCVSESLALTSASADGTWSSSNTSLGAVDASGNVTGITAGTLTITYTLSTGCFATKAITIKPLPAAISGASSICQGSAITLTDATTGSASWSSGNTSVATIGSATGVVAGIAEGTTTITYTLSTGCRITKDISVNPLPSAITGTATVCVGQTASLSATPSSGGTWASGTTAKATVDVSSGIVTGIAAGTSMITFTSCAGCISTRIVTVNALPGAITGPNMICAGSTSTLSTTTTGGTWSSSDDLVASVSGSSIVSGIGTGVAMISYTTASGCVGSMAVTVAAAAASITGSSAVCVGKTTALSNAAGGGTWSSSNTSFATVNSGGIVTGVAVGTVNITYTLTAGCRSVLAMTVNSPVSAISGATSVCAGSAITLTTASSGGTWSSNNTSLATVDASTGIVTGVSAGTATISYILPTGCYAVYSVLVRPVPAPISGSATLCTGGMTTLTDATTGGLSWSSSDVSVATVGSMSGIVAGVGAGTANITYTVSSGCSTFIVVTVNAGASIMGGLSVCAGSSTTLTASVAGGSWSSGTLSVASITSGGVVTGVTGGTSIITYAQTSGCSSYTVFTVNALPGAITGATTICMGSTSALGSTTTGGTWSSSNDVVASVGTSGVASGNTVGTATINYYSNLGCLTSAIVTVTSAVTDITGGGPLCVGSTITLGNPTSGGTWSSSNASVATVTSAGVVAGVAEGAVNITYALSSGCRSILPLTVGSGAGSITGPVAVCANSVISLSASVTGGSWSSGNTSLATVDASGNVTGVSAGTVTVSYVLAGGCVASHSILVKAQPVAISGVASLCVGSTTTYTDATSGGVSWLSSDPSIASIGSTSGVLTAVSAGVVQITYTISTGCSITKAVTINALPGDISGTLQVCQGLTTIAVSSASGGTWSSSSSSIASIDAFGVITGVATGTAIISYSLGGSCVTLAVVTVNPLPAAITAPAIICAGSASAFTSATAGGSWASSNDAFATVSSAGVVTGITPGVVNISYTLTTGCSRVATVTIVDPSSPITGTPIVCVGTTTMLGNAIGGGIWTSSNTSIATAATGGIITGVAVGTTTITYSSAPGCRATIIVTVNTAMPGITGTTVLNVGATTTLSNAMSGGTWTSGNTSYATVTSSGVVTGVAAGFPSISYTAAGCTVFAALTINPTVLPIAGNLSICVGATSTLTDATPGGMSWASSNPAVATIGSISGVVTGISAGTSTISFLTSSGTVVTAIMTINAIPPFITGPTAVCVGATVTKLNATPGGAWSTSTATFGTIDPTSGVMTGISAGTTVVSYTVAGCVRTAFATVNALPAAIVGYITICTGSTSAFSDVTTGGTWSSADASVSSIVSTTGIATGEAAGNTTLSYTLTSTGCFRTQTVSVTVPTPNTGASTVCVGATGTIANATSGGTWTSASTAIATIGGTTGIATGVASGSVNLTYTLNAGCKVVSNITVNPAAAAVTGTSSVCLGNSVTLSNVSSGGTWSSGNTSLATVSSSGEVTGIAAGTPVITYMLPTGCFKTLAVSVKALPAAIGGSATVCAPGTTTLTDASSPGSWATSASGIASIGASSGVVTGVSAGTAIITFTATATGCKTTRVQTVNTAGSISGPSSVSIAASAVTPVLYSGSISGGMWASSNTLKATIDAAGNLTGHAAGTVNVLYTVSGCTVGLGITITSPRGSGNTVADQQTGSIELFPNPATGVFSIRSEVAGIMTIISVDGRLLGRYEISAGVTNISLPTDIAAGNYLCRFTVADGDVTTIQLVYKP